MAEGFIEKTKGFFGFGAVESYDDGAFPHDDFDDYTDRGDRADRADRGRLDHVDRVERQDRGSYGDSRYGEVPGRHSHDRYASQEPTSRLSAAPSSVAAGVPAQSGVDDRRASYTPASAPAREPEVVVVEVREYRDAAKVTPEARRGDLVAFNLGALDKAQGNQFLAFVTGLAAAFEGKLEKLDGVRNFVLVPAGFGLTHDIREALVTQLTGER